MPQQAVHLICNAHLDPIWLWQWEEGAAEAVSTFRVAAELCEQSEGFVFNHNEVILYKWVEQYEPELFARIQRLVKAGKWHIMGGWYVQPDCNMPSGESFVRQGLLGRQYFKQKFNAAPTTAINFDSFGHSRGLVQILARSGFDSYVFTRPAGCPLPGDEFVWVGYDGSEILAARARGSYFSFRGQAAEKVRRVMADRPDASCLPVLWGVGNHGGGPSRQDLRDLTRLIAGAKDADIRHSTPEQYFRDLSGQKSQLPRHEKDINPFAVGCYTSMVRIKQRHRQLENELFSVEKMVCAAVVQGLMDYPGEQLHEAACDLAFSQFHDILPGSSIQPAEESALRAMDRALEELSRIKARAFFALSAGQRRAREGQIPILAYNPHPYTVRSIFECEFQLADQNYDHTFTDVLVYQGNKLLPCQVEKELSNLTLDWRKRVAFYAELKPGMSRFDCRLRVIPKKPSPKLKARGGKIRFRTSEMDVVINTRTGLVDRYRVGGVDCVRANAFQPVVCQDNEDAWAMRVKRFGKVVGRFKLASPAQAASYAGVRAKQLPPIRVIEDGPARSVVEVLYVYRDSRIRVHYRLPKQGSEIEIAIVVNWNAKDRALKLAVPMVDGSWDYRGQTAYGVADLHTNGDEVVAQKWLAAVNDAADLAVTCIGDGGYGSDFSDNTMRVTLLRSPAYSGHPIRDRQIVPQDRHTGRIDQGERHFCFRFNAGKVADRLGRIDRESLGANEQPFVLSFFPAGGGVKPKPLATLSDKVVQASAIKKADCGEGIIVRLYEPTGKPRSTTLSLPAVGMKTKVTLGAFEVKTLLADLAAKTFSEVNLLEQPVGG